MASASSAHMASTLFRRRLRSISFFVTLCLASPSFAAEPHWIRVASSHFVVLTDGDEKQGREVVVRFEQMRAVFGDLLSRNRVNLSLPLDIIALKSDEEYGASAPAPGGKPMFATAFALPGQDREFFVLDLAEPDSWRAISHEVGRMLLNYNYPPTQAWFDEGFTQYFASIHLDNKQMQLGEDPEANPAVRQSVLGKPAGSRTQPLVELLNKTSWMPLATLFTAKPEGGDNRQTLFYAQSWMVMHYLINKNKLAETGTYFALVQNENLPVEDAIQKAYGVSSAQLEAAVKDYFQSLAASVTSRTPAAAPVTYDDVGASAGDVPEAQGRAAVAEMQLRIAERHDQAQQLLESLIGQQSTDNAVARRALGWDYLSKNQYEKAIEELTTAEEQDNRDPWPRYYLALTRYRQAQVAGQQVSGLANMMQDLHVVLNVRTECAEAYYMLGWAQRAGGSVRAATDSIRAAIRLAPRNQNYLLEMAQVYLAGKDWDAGTALLQRLTSSPEPQVATAARANLQDVPYLMKYGIAPAHTPAGTATSPPTATPATATAAKPPATPVATVASPASHPQNKAATKPSPSESGDLGDENLEVPSGVAVDKRPIRYSKGKLISVDCTQAPAAVVTFSTGLATLKLHTADYKSLTLIGADAFSCTWANRQVTVNYRAKGATDGDLVSLEVR